MTQAMPVAVCVLITALAVSHAVNGDDSKPEKSEVVFGAAATDLMPVNSDEARRQAVLMHDLYLSTLHAIHREYFDSKQRDTLPARMMEDVFRQMDEQTQGRTRWISVNTPAMNVDHEPKPGFEQDAAKALSSGSTQYERIEAGQYHRAGAVRFFAVCNRCHMSGLSQSQSGRMAALVISLPVRD